MNTQNFSGHAPSHFTLHIIWMVYFLYFAFTVWSMLFLFNIRNILGFSTLDYFLPLCALQHQIIKLCFLTLSFPTVYFIFWTLNLMNHFLFHHSVSISLSFIILAVPTLRHIYFIFPLSVNFSWPVSSFLPFWWEYKGLH